MNNVGALALLMPVAISLSKRPSQILMPLSFGTILGGLTTLIGTPPNIIVSNYREQITGEPFGLFAFSPVGGVLAFVGLGVPAAHRLAPDPYQAQVPVRNTPRISRSKTTLPKSSFPKITP